MDKISPTPEQLAQTKSDVLWLISAGILKNNGDDSYSLTKEAKTLVKQLIESEEMISPKLPTEKRVLVACVVTVLKISKGFLEDVVTHRYAAIVRHLYEVEQEKETAG